ncbi:3305_t:CDS:2, partial [Acaulospora morrowiae]
MPPHTTLQYTMPSNTTTNSKPTSITSSSGITQLAATPKPSNTNATTRQRRATSASSYVFAPSWLINNKTVPAVTEGKSTKEDAKGVGSSKKEELGVVKQVKDGNSSLSSFAHASANGSAQLTSIRTKPKDFSSSRLKTLEETDGNEEVAKTLHGRSRSVSQTNSSTISSSPSSFDRNFPTLAKKKQFPLSVDLQTKGVDNMW